ncbi:MAG: SMP-30/gluconolactonase/LRE family protein [Cyclobacteriaceae bacterium]
MKKVLVILSIVAFLLATLVLHILYSGGFFREIIPKNTASIIQNLRISGAEDIAISREDNFLIISSDDRASRRDGRPIQGGLYFVDLTVSPFSSKLLDFSFNQPFYPHGISLLKLDSGYQLLVINHVNEKHSIEKFWFNQGVLTHEETLKDASMISPNDLVATSPTSFYFTNDHHYAPGFMRVLEDYLGLQKSNVVYADGGAYQEVATGIAYANGINIDTKLQLMFVASPRDFLVKVYQVEPDSQLTFIEDIDAGTGVDNIEFDEEGNIWIGCHPNLLAFSSYAKGKRKYSPSEIIKIVYESKGQYEITSVFVDEGENLSSSTVAVPHQDKVFVGTVMDEKVMILDSNFP